MKITNNISFEDTSVAFSSRTDKELRKMHFLFAFMNKSQLTKIGTNFVKTALRLKLPIKNLIKNTIFQHFCAGESLKDCEKTIYNLGIFQIKSIPDYSVEAGSSEENFDVVVNEIISVIELASKNELVEFVVFKVTGLCRGDLLEKVQRGATLTEKEHGEFNKLKQRMDLIAQKAFEKDIKVLIDAEESWIQSTIDVLVYTLMAKYNREKALIFNTFQMYRVDMPHNLQKALDMAEKGSFYLGVKLVRGAYLEKERKRAKDFQYSDPIFSTKQETDKAFNDAIRFCVLNRERISICLGSHNEESNLLMLEEMNKFNVQNNDSRFFFAQLYGMSDHISFNLAKAGYNVSKYLPYGPVETVIPYLIRRAEENKSVTGQSSRELTLIEKEIERRKSLENPKFQKPNSK
ncbi:MAG TPA: proline dehydrogenase family protein [Cytophagaceae bacterium]